MIQSKTSKRPGTLGLTGIGLAALLLLVQTYAGVDTTNNLSRPPAEYFIYGRFFIVAYVLVIAAIWMSNYLQRSKLKHSIILLLALAATTNVIIYWVGEYMTGYARWLVATHLEMPAMIISSILLILLFIRAKKLPSNDAANAKKRSRLVLSIAITLIVTAFSLFAFIRYTPNNIAGETDNTSLPDMPEHTGVTVSILNTGFNRMSKALSPGDPEWRPAPVFLIHHPKYGYLLFDCGVSKDVALQGESALPFPMSLLFESRSSAALTIDAQLARQGIQQDSIKTIIISHLHEDHTGGLPFFNNARVIVHSNTALKAGILKVVNASSFTKCPDFLGKTFDLFGDGTLLLIEAEGHTKHDLLLLVAGDKGPVLLTGDAVVHFDWLYSNDVERLPENPAGAARIRNAIRHLLHINKDLVVLPGHDIPSIPSSRTDIVKLFPEHFIQQQQH